jgi:hypothetical protein
VLGAVSPKSSVKLTDSLRLEQQKFGFLRHSYKKAIGFETGKLVRKSAGTHAYLLSATRFTVANKPYNSARQRAFLLGSFKSVTPLTKRMLLGYVGILSNRKCQCIFLNTIELHENKPILSNCSVALLYKNTGKLTLWGFSVFVLHIYNEHVICVSH